MEGTVESNKIKWWLQYINIVIKYGRYRKYINLKRIARTEQDRGHIKLVNRQMTHNNKCETDIEYYMKLEHTLSFEPGYSDRPKYTCEILVNTLC